MILKAEANLVPMGPRSPLRFGRCRTDVPRTSCNPSSARLRSLWGRRPWFKVSPPARSARGMRSPGPHSPHLPQGFGCCVAGAPWFKVSPPARSARGMRPPGPHSPHLPQGFGCCGAGAHGSKVSAPLRSAQSRHPPDVLRSPLRFGRCRTDVPRTSCNPSSALKWGKLNYTDFAQNCILDQKERTSL